MSKLSEALDEQTTAINANIDATNDVLTEVRQLIQNGQSAEADALVGKVQENNNLIKTATETLKTVAAEADAENGDPQPTE